jgi:hypothetical protein
MWNSPWITAVIEGKIESERRRNKLETPFTNQVMLCTGIRTYSGLKRNVDDIEK